MTAQDPGITTMATLRHLTPGERVILQKPPKSVRSLLSRVRKEFDGARKYHSKATKDGVEVWRLT
jgi:hypothetical protein